MVGNRGLTVLQPVIVGKVPLKMDININSKGRVIEMDDGTPFTARVKISWNFGLFKRECVYEYVQILEVDAVCIVCGTPTVFDMDYPVCSACYIKPRFNSKCDLLRCHVCGEPSPRISYEKPLCYSCYQENC